MLLVSLQFHLKIDEIYMFYSLFICWKAIKKTMKHINSSNCRGGGIFREKCFDTRKPANYILFYKRCTWSAHKSCTVGAEFTKKYPFVFQKNKKIEWKLVL